MKNILSVLTIGILSFSLFSILFAPQVNAQSSLKVLIDEGHSEWLVSGNAQKLIQALQNKGYVIDSFSGTVTQSLLSSYNVFLIGTAWVSFTDSEIQAIENFVQNGGGLWLIGLGWSWVDYHPYSTIFEYPMNEIAQRFGAFYNPDIIFDPTDYITDPSHPIFHTPFIEIHPTTLGASLIGATEALVGSISIETGTILITGDDDSHGGYHESPYPDLGMYPPMLAAISYGSGKVVIQSHEWFVTDDHIDEYDNKILGLNIVDWLACVHVLEFHGAEDLVGNEGLTGHTLSLEEANLYLQIFEVGLGGEEGNVFAGLKAWCLFTPPQIISDPFTIVFPAILNYYYKLTGIAWGEVEATIGISEHYGDEWNLLDDGIGYQEDFWALGQSEGEKDDYAYDIAYAFSDILLLPSETYKIEIIWSTDGYCVGSYLFGGDETYDDASFFSRLQLFRPYIRMGTVPPYPTSLTKPDGITITANSPLELLVEDPTGRRVGFDPTSGDPVNEVPGAYYTGVGSYPHMIAIPYPLLGVHIIDLFGTGTGSYTLELCSYDSNGLLIASQTYAGRIAEGAVYVYSVALGDGSMTVEPDPMIELGYLKEFIDGLPDGCFDQSVRRASHLKKALFNKIDEAILKVEAGNYTDAINKLFHDIRVKMDGDSTSKDWIICQTSEFCTIVDHIIDGIETLRG